MNEITVGTLRDYAKSYLETFFAGYDEEQLDKLHYMLLYVTRYERAKWNSLLDLSLHLNVSAEQHASWMGKEDFRVNPRKIRETVMRVLEEDFAKDKEESSHQ